MSSCRNARILKREGWDSFVALCKLGWSINNQVITGPHSQSVVLLTNNVVDETLQNRSFLVSAEVVPGLVDWFIQGIQQCIQKSKICFRLLFYLIIKYIQMLRDEGQYDDTFTCSCVSQIVWAVNCIISVATSVYLLHLNQECSMINAQSDRV